MKDIKGIGYFKNIYAGIWGKGVTYDFCYRVEAYGDLKPYPVDRAIEAHLAYVRRGTKLVPSTMTKWTS